MTFEPLPRELFARVSSQQAHGLLQSAAPVGDVPRPLSPSPRLTTACEKLSLFRAVGIDDVLLVPFNSAFSAMSAGAFADLLFGPINARWLMVGEDFRFGAQRCGDVTFLREHAKRGCAETATMPAVTFDGGRVSSTRVRAALAAGDLPLAAQLLGRRYSITGHVVHGDKRGRTIGFPTANVALGRARRALPPLWGVYAVKCAVQQKGVAPSCVTLCGAASLGRNPAVKVNGPPSFEVHLFDFAGDLYGARVTVEFHHKLRDEATYDSLDALTSAIANDCALARQLLGFGT
jgi:riboflavin kinase/FMN adenylyltransferase